MSACVAWHELMVFEHTLHMCCDPNLMSDDYRQPNSRTFFTTSMIRIEKIFVSVECIAGKLASEHCRMRGSDFVLLDCVDTFGGTTALASASSRETVFLNSLTIQWIVVCKENCRWTCWISHKFLERNGAPVIYSNEKLVCWENWNFNVHLETNSLTSLPFST